LAVADCLARHVRPEDHLCVALSGGVDSLVLLRVIASAGWRQLSAIHVHHGLSPNADHWAQYCEKVCASLTIPFVCAHVAVDRASHDGLEAAARRARHAAFAGVRADWILLAHHRDDQAETLLFNLLRGAGFAGAAAMQERKGRMLRPLLEVGREDILAYARAHRLDWVEDESNADTRHTRNFLRHEVFPVIHRRFPAASGNLAAAATRFAEGIVLLDALARADLGKAEDFPIPCTLLADLDEPRARNALRYLLARQGVRIPGEARLRETLRQLLGAAEDRHPETRFDGHRLYRRRGAILLEKEVAGNAATM